ncbi:MAG TPA: MFS transporter [Rhodocyclaceae bacterium]|nr:MFS transporter [Rhodocyclaceae bacterium]
MQKTSWAAVALVIGTGMVAATAIGKVPPALPALREQLDLSMVEAGWVMATFATLGSCCALFFGGLSARVGQLRLALIGLATMVAGAGLGALADGYPLLLASRVLEGSGFIAVVVTLPSLIAHSTAPRDQRLALGLWSIYLPFGSSVVMLTAPLVLDTVDWRGLWLVLAAAALACALLLYRMRARLVPVASPPAAAPGAGVLVDTLRQPGAWCLAIAFFTYTLQWFTLMVWLPSFLVDERGLSVSLAGALTAAVVAANVPGNVLGGWLVHRHIGRGTLVAAASLFMLACAFGIFDERLPDALRYGLCLLFTSVGGVLPAAAFSGLTTHAPSPRHVGAVNGLLVQGSNLGQFVGPPAVAAVVTASGAWQAATGIMEAAALIGVASGLALVRIEGTRAVLRTAAEAPSAAREGRSR